MKASRIVLDTNVFVSALRSRRGASFRLLASLPQGQFKLCVSVPLVLEYEDAAKRTARDIGLHDADVDDTLDYLCLVAERLQIYFLWRPFLRDPGDDMILELAVTAEADFIVTFNLRDFVGCQETFGIPVVTPQEFLRYLGARS